MVDFTYKLYCHLPLLFPSLLLSLGRDLGGVSSTCDTIIPLVLIDTAGLDLRELDTLEEESKGNEGWVGVVKDGRSVITLNVATWYMHFFCESFLLSPSNSPSDSSLLPIPLSFQFLLLPIPLSFQSLPVCR